jgi:hypothetical protein
MKRRVTLNLEEGIIDTLNQEGRSLSAVVNSILHEAIGQMAHQRAMLRWLDELDAKYGAPSPEELKAADDLLDSIERGETGIKGAA